MAKNVSRLFSYFEPEKYDIELDLDNPVGTFSGKVVIKGAKVGRPAKRITLHQKNLKIHEVTLTHIDKKQQRSTIPVIRKVQHRSFDELRLHTEQTLHRGQYEITILYTGTITPQMHGLYPCNYSDQGSPAYLLATQFEPHHAREVIPCIDEPEAKAIFTLTLISQPDTINLSNMPVVSAHTINKRLHTTFEPTPRMSTYLLAVVSGSMRHISKKTAQGTQVSVYATPAHAKELRFALDTAVKTLEFFEDYFQIPYPLPKLDLAALPDFTAGAMENWGLITFRELALLVKPESSSLATKQMVALVIAHEIAHQWFGNLVTMRWWNDLWLNESFAKMMEYVCVDKLFPEWNIWQAFSEREFSYAMNRDAMPNVQSVQCHVRHPDEIDSLFDPAIVYAKGAALLNMLRSYIGEDSFRHGLHAYFEQHTFSNTDADDLWQALRKASDIDVRSFMEPWLQRSGFPLIRVSHNPNLPEVSFHQERFMITSKEVANHMSWPVPLRPIPALDEEVIHGHVLHTKLRAGNSLQPLILNADAHSFFLTHYENRHHRELLHTAAATKELSDIDRNYILHCSLLLQRGRFIPLIETLELLDAYQHDDDDKIWQTIAGILAETRRLVLGQPAAEAALRAYTTRLIEPLLTQVGWDAVEQETPQRHHLRGLLLQLASLAEIPSVLDEGQRRFRVMRDIGDVAPDIRVAVCTIGVRFGGSHDFHKLLSLHNASSSSEERLVAASALTCSRRKANIQTILDQLNTTHIRPQDVKFWFAWLIANTHARGASWQWMAQNWPWIYETFSKTHIYETFPRAAAAVFSTQAEHKKYTAFFSPKTSEKSLQRAIHLGIEEIAARVAWRKANETAVIQWFTKES